MMKVYLAGFMSGDQLKETTEWRQRIRSFYSGKGWDIVCLDPYNGKDVATITGEGLKSSVTPHGIVHRDYMSVMAADVLVCNMNTFGSKRPLTGTICEMAWAWEHHKPIIMITDDPKYKEHPFTEYFASFVYSTVEEMLKDKALDYMYKGIHSAVYDVGQIVTTG